jgi:putative transposase
MRLQALEARPRRRRLPPDLGERQATAVAANVLDRSFGAAVPNRKWIADFTYVWTAEGWLYVAAVVDLFSRRVVGWSMSAAMTAQLVTDALVMAIWRRGKPDALLRHSDRGSQYTSEQFQRLNDRDHHQSLQPLPPERRQPVPHGVLQRAALAIVRHLMC